MRDLTERIETLTDQLHTLKERKEQAQALLDQCEVAEQRTLGAIAALRELQRDQESESVAEQEPVNVNGTNAAPAKVKN